jgi:hypothetical protein
MVQMGHRQPVNGSFAKAQSPPRSMMAPSVQRARLSSARRLSLAQGTPAERRCTDEREAGHVRGSLAEDKNPQMADPFQEISAQIESCLKKLKVAGTGTHWGRKLAKTRAEKHLNDAKSAIDKMRQYGGTTSWRSS